MSTVFKALSPATKIIGVEPEGAPSMKAAFKKGEVIQLETIDNFVDGAAVKRVGDKNFLICKENLHDMITVPEGSACQAILDLYNKDATFHAYLCNLYKIQILPIIHQLVLTVKLV